MIRLHILMDWQRIEKLIGKKKQWAIEEKIIERITPKQRHAAGFQFLPLNVA